MPERSSHNIGTWPWLRERLFPRGTNLILWTSFVILVSMFILYVLGPPEVNRFQFYSTLVALALLMVINIMMDDLRKLLPNEQASLWVIILVSSALAFYTILVGKMYMAIYIILMITVQVNALLPTTPALGFSLLLAGGYMGIFAWSGASQPEIQGTALGLLIGMTFTITLSQVLLRYSEQTERANRLLEQLKQANTELLAARQKEKELAVAEERVRVARDLHDGLGHHLTALSIQLQAAEKLVKSDPDQATEAVHNARGEIQAALKEVRQSVASLREVPVDQQQLPESIARLVEETGKRAGLTALFTLEGQPVILSPAATMTLYRAAQEGLTNILKHAQQVSQVSVNLVYQANEVCLRIADNGLESSTPSSEAAKGFGLAGLRERASLLGGRIEFGVQSPSGFVFVITLPYSPP